MELEEFLKLNGIDINEFYKRFGSEKLVNYNAYDEGIAFNAIFGDYVRRNVDIAQIVGLPDYLIREQNIIDNFSLVFAPSGDIYDTRANGMLKYSSSEVLEGLQRSFIVEPIRLVKIKDKYFISSNGSHRFQLLKMHYLMSLFKGENVDGRFVIPVEAKELDYTKTFANYIASQLWDEKFDITIQHDAECKLTGDVIVSYKGEEIVMNDQKLIKFLGERLNTLKKIDEGYYFDVIHSMWGRAKWEETGLFKEFIANYFPEFVYVLDALDFGDLHDRFEEKLIRGVQYGNS